MQSDQRSEDADRHVAFRISRFLRGGRDSIEADIGEEDHAGRAENAEDSAVGMRDALRGCVGRRLGDQRRVVGGIDEAPANADEEQDDRRLQDNDEAVDESRFLGAADKQEQ